MHGKNPRVCLEVMCRNSRRLSGVPLGFLLLKIRIASPPPTGCPVSSLRGSLPCILGIIEAG